jgi:ATP-dependent RNA helicase DeaD
MMRHGRLRLSRGHIPSLDEIEEVRENQFFEKLRTTLEEGGYPPQDRLIDRLLEQGHASTDIAAAVIHLMHSRPEVPSPEPAGQWGHDDRGGRSDRRGAHDRPDRHEKPSYDRPGRTGREQGFVTLFFNVGRKQAVKPGDLVGKIAGVTRLPAQVVGAIDLKQRHSLIDVQEQHADEILDKLVGVRLRGVTLQPVPAAQAEG